MAYKRPEIESLEFDVRTGQKKYVRYNEGAKLYSMGIHGFMALAKEAKAVRKVKGVCLVNTEVINKYIEDTFSEM